MTNAIDLTRDMIKRRDDMRLILGANYEAHAREARSVLRGLSSDAGISLANVALKVSKAMLANGHDPSIVIAALVDELTGQPDSAKVAVSEQSSTELARNAEGGKPNVQ